MDHSRVRTLLHGYIDGELDLVNALEVEEHLRTCPDCSRLYAALKEEQALIADNSRALYYPAPPALRTQIIASIRQSGRAQRSGFQLRWWQAAVAGLAVVLIILIAGVASGWFAAGQNRQLAAEVQSAHVRSLMANHLTDIPSTDQHTVKPWFDGKLDFSPPVANLSAQGYPLIGGRLDYLDGRQVAALVYMRNKHIINLFIWPSTVNVNGLTASIINGYNIYHWSQSGMEYWAVSDLNDLEMRTFIGLVQKTNSKE